MCSTGKGQAGHGDQCACFDVHRVKLSVAHVHHTQLPQTTVQLREAALRTLTLRFLSCSKKSGGGDGKDDDDVTAYVQGP